MDLNDLFSDASESEWDDLPELGASASFSAGIKSPFSIVGRVTAAASNAATLSVAIKKALQAGATPAQIATLRKSSPKAIANIAKASIPQIQRLMRMSPKQIAALRRMTPAQAARLRTATPKQVKLLRLAKAKKVRKLKPVKRVKLARVVAAKKALPINCTAPAAYRQLACTAGVGGEAGLSMLKHIQAMVDLANTRSLATSEHNAINNTLAFRRAVLKGLRQRQRACR